MKRIIFLSIVTLFTISNYAQIETYESVSPKNTISLEEVQKQYPNLSEEEQIQLYFELRSGGKAKGIVGNTLGSLTVAFVQGERWCFLQWVNMLFTCVLLLYFQERKGGL